jgi:hypothetical protein
MSTAASYTPAARKFLRTAIIVAIASVSFFGFVNGANASSGFGAKTQFEYVSVSAGETLWSMADRLAPNSDPRDWIQEVVNLNGLTSTDLTPGQRIAIP